MFSYLCVHRLLKMMHSGCYIPFKYSLLYDSLSLQREVYSLESKNRNNEYLANFKYITEVLDPVEIYVECFLDLVNSMRVTSSDQMCSSFTYHYGII